MTTRLIARSGPRMAAAPLEFVLCMPILLVLLVSLVWLGFSVVTQSQVAVEARRLAWQQRFQPQGPALLFLEDQFVEATSTDQVEVSPLLDDMPPPEATHEVMAGSWDHAALPLADAPHWREYAQVALNAKTGNLQTTYTDAQNEFGDWKNKSRQVWQTLGQQLLAEITGMGAAAEAEIGKAEESETDGSKEIRKIDREIARVEAELAKTQSILRGLHDRKNNGAGGDAADSLDARIEMHRKKVERLKSDLSELESERDEVATA